jgi:hypothetical protein
MRASTEIWKSTPDEHDYPAAASYLSMVAPKHQVERLIAELRSAESVTGKAKDLLRASTLTALGRDNPHVAHDLEKIHQGIALSPLLAIRGDVASGLPLIIADGYHRLCASYISSEDADVQYRIVERRGP